MLKNYLTEIISKRQWRNKNSFEYRDLAKNFIDFKDYKVNLKKLKDIFRKLNHGTFKSTIVYDYESIKVETTKLNYDDKIIIKFLEKLDYEISEESYLLGFAKKDDKTILIKNILDALKSKRYANMMLAYVKTKNEEIKKQADALEYLTQNINREEIENTHAYLIGSEKQYKIVISIQPRLIASQSTEVGWDSCMHLIDGSNRKYVGTGITAGVIIAYLVKTGDEKNLDHPTARVLIKPFKSKTHEGELVWKTDKIYGTASESFRLKVDKIFEPFNSDRSGHYKINTGVYSDDLDQEIYHYSKEQQKMLDDNNFTGVEKLPNYEEFVKRVITDEKNINILKYLKKPSLSLKKLAIKYFNLNNNTLMQPLFDIIPDIKNNQELMAVLIAHSPIGPATGEQIFDFLGEENIKKNLTSFLSYYPETINKFKFSIQELFEVADGHNKILRYIKDTDILKELFDIARIKKAKIISQHFLNALARSKENILPVLKYLIDHGQADIIESVSFVLKTYYVDHSILKKAKEYAKAKNIDLDLDNNW